MRKSVWVLFAGLIAGQASAQEMGYSSGGHQSRPDYVQSISPDDGLNVDWLNLPSDVTLNKWAQKTYQSHFDAMDTNRDTVLSEEDLVRPDPEEAQRWAQDEIQQIFTVWLPELGTHLQDLDARARGFGAEHKMLAPAAQAGQQIKAVMQGLGVLGRNWGDTYLEVRIVGDTKLGGAGEVAQGARSWVSVEVPIDLVFHRGAEVEPQTYSYTATMLGISRFSRNEDEPRFALWDIGLASR